jgi:hypothetical protein
MFFYYSQWAFLTIFVLGFVAALFKRPRNNDEEQALLDDARRRQRYGGADQFRDNHSPNPVLASTAEPNSS